MNKPKDQCRKFGVWLKSKPALISAKIIQRLVNDRQSYDCINDIGIDAPAKQNPKQHCCRVAKGENAHIHGHVSHSVKKEDNAQKKENVVISGHHMFGAKINEGNDMDAPDFLNVASIPLGDVMRIGCCAQHAK